MVKVMWIKDRAQMDRISRLACDAPYEIVLRVGSADLDARDLTAANMDRLVGRTVSLVAEDRADPTHFGCLVEQMEGKRNLRRILRERMEEIAGRQEPHYGWETRMQRLQS